MISLSLKAVSRKIFGQKVKKLRKNNLIPAVIYGHGSKSSHLELERGEFEKIFRQAGKNTIIDLIIDNKTNLKALIHDLQYDPLQDKIIHIDFYQIKEKEKVSVDVVLKFTGESPAVKEKGGTIVHHLSKIKIEALPKDLIHEIEIDISKLQEFNALIRVKDIKLSPEIKVLNGDEEVIVSVAAPRVEEEAATTVKVEETATTTTTATTAEKTEEQKKPETKPEKKPQEKK